MDKKKVEELIGKAKEYILAYQKNGKNSDIAMAFLNLQSAERELSKSDWVSVEDGLPEYGEEVWVTSKLFPSSIYKCRRAEGSIVPKDSHDFIILWEGRMAPITHWRRIDKLEV